MQPETLALFIPITALIIPIVAILVRHQQKMAEIIHSQPQQAMQPNSEMESMRRDMNSMRELLNQQAIQMDTLIQQQRSLNAPPQQPVDIPTRLGQ